MTDSYEAHMQYQVEREEYDDSDAWEVSLANPGVTPPICPDCEGSGMLSDDGYPAFSCPRCKGLGAWPATDSTVQRLARGEITLATDGIVSTPMAEAELADVRARAPYAIADEAAAVAYLRWERERMSAEGR